MAGSADSPEQRQLQEEIKAVVTNIRKFQNLKEASFEIEQGRKLIEKAAKIGLPEQSYADLQRYMTTYDNEASGRPS